MVIGGNSAVQQFTRIGRLVMLVVYRCIKDAFHLAYIVNRNYLNGLNLIGLRRKKYDNKKIMELSDAYKQIFAAKNLQKI